MKKILFVLIAFSCLSCKYDPLHMNQPAAQTFEKAVEQQDRLLNLEVNAVAPSNDGGYVVVGRKENQEGGEFGFWIKTDETGQVRRRRTIQIIQRFNIEANTRDVETVADQGYGICGFSVSENGNKNFFRVDLLSETGNFIWTYEHPVPSEAYQLEQTSDGGFIAVGHEASDILVMKIDSEGNQEWEDKSISPGWAYAVIDEGNDQYTALMYDSDANENFLYRFSSDNTSTSKIILPDNLSPIYKFDKLTNGNYVFLDPFVTGDFANTDVVVVDEAGGVVWDTTVFDVWLKSVVASLDGGLLACGETFGIGASDAYLVKFSADGEEVWKRFFGKNLSESAEDLVKLPDGGIFMGGIDYSLSDEEDPPGDKGVYVLRTDRDGMVN